jgi:hypothetical protein
MNQPVAPRYVPVVEADEFLHPVPPDAHHTYLESSYFGFNCPSAGLDGQIYIWFHPALRVMTFMIYIFKGINHDQLAAEYFNEHVYLPMLPDIRDYELRLGTCRIRVKVVKPLEEMHIRIEDAPRSLDLDWVTRAAAPPIGRPGGGHLTQLMENSGTLSLRGETYDIAGYFVRDRSWGYNRGEEPQMGPPYNWTTGLFGPKLGFLAAVLDTSIFPEIPEYGPNWFRRLDLGDATKTMRWDSNAEAGGINLRHGWWWAGGAPRQLVDVGITTRLLPGKRVPAGVEMLIRDETGERHAVTGQLLSYMPKMYGQNCVSDTCFMRWTYGQEIGYGEMLIVYDNEHLWRMRQEA